MANPSRKPGVAIPTALLSALLSIAPAMAGAANPSGPTGTADEPASQADFLFVGSYHMDNPGNDVHNMRADDVLSEKRQRDIDEIVARLKRFRPTRVVVEADTSRQAVLQSRFDESCHGERPLTRNEVEQLGFRIACESGLAGVDAVDWNELGPFRDEDAVDYLKAVERHGQQQVYQAHLDIGARRNDEDQRVLDAGSILDMLAHLNSRQWLADNAHAYHRIGMLGTAEDPIGANWVQLWFARNQMIFNNIVRRTQRGDRVLVIYGAGHGNLIRQLAEDSGIYRIHDPVDWLAGKTPR